MKNEMTAQLNKEVSFIFVNPAVRFHVLKKVDSIINISLSHSEHRELCENYITSIILQLPVPSMKVKWKEKINYHISYKII